MNTVDPNEKVAKISQPAVPEQQAHVAFASNGNESNASQPSAQEHKEAAPPADLPSYHHHRSTALW